MRNKKEMVKMREAMEAELRRKEMRVAAWEHDFGRMGYDEMEVEG